jgi:hypothetical protein
MRNMPRRRFEAPPLRSGSEPAEVTRVTPDWFLRHFDALLREAKEAVLRGTEGAVPRGPSRVTRAAIRRRPGRPGVAAVAMLLLTAALRVNAQSGSASYVLQQSTLNGGGQAISSANFRMTASLTQESVIGVSSSPGHVLQSGFWSYYGAGLVPVLLLVHKNGATPADPDLSWSGNNAPYVIYRQFGASASSACGSVFGNLLTSQTPQFYTDTSPPASPLTCYNVLATAPGPVPPEPAERGAGAETSR